MLRTLVAAFLLIFMMLPASAAEGVRVSEVVGGYGHSGKQILNGIRVDLAPGWHAYWKSPGQAGLPPELTVSGVNTGETQILLPVPERFTSAGFEAVGYQRSFIIPILTDIVDPSLSGSLQVKGRIYACSDLCVPFEVDTSIPFSPSRRDLKALEELSSWLARSPGGALSSIRLLEAEATSDGDVIVRLSSTTEKAPPSVFLDLGADGFARLRSIEDLGEGIYSARFAVDNYRTVPEDFSAARVIAWDGLTPPLEAPLELSQTLDWHILVIALAGGLILNAMPCVFPVLAIKLLMLASINRRRLRWTLCVTSLGMISTFAVMGIALALIKAAGHSVGWGQHFQQPVFLAGMALLLLVFGASMGGAFQILLPSAFATRITAVTDGEGPTKAFLQGAVLTLLATPCSAPFVGTAVGYGLSRGAGEIISIFLALGVGMAFPFLLLSVVPAFLKLVPRPGRWMDHVKDATAVAMFATAGWLATLLYSTGSVFGLALVLLVAVVVIGALAAGSRRFALMLALALALVPSLSAMMEALSVQPRISWDAFDAAAIDRHVASGDTVFINISAEWCLTCKVNERTTLADKATAELIEQETVPIKGDWTRPDEQISAYLRQNGRYGIPFYIVVGPKAPNGIVLPELLSPSDVREAIGRASGLNL